MVDTFEQQFHAAYDWVMIYQISLRAFTSEGTLEAAAKMLPFLSTLGFTHVQLTPVVLADDDGDRAFWSRRQMASGTQNPKNTYRIKDYFTIDEEYGTDTDLRAFVAVAHMHGLKVMLDLVYYHCAPHAVFLKEHPDFVKRSPDGTPALGPWNFPELNFDNPALEEYLWSNMVYFVEEFDIDGYRMDVGDYVPLDFWAEGIKRVRAIKPDLFMLNEGRNPAYLNVFDANYFYDGFSDSVPIAKGELPASAYQEKWLACRKMLPPGGRMLRFFDSHDIASDSYEDRHEKTLGSLGVDALLALHFLMDGIPFLFNGYEVADDLKHNMFSNRYYGRDAAVNWANALTEKGAERTAFIRRLTKMRSEHESLTSGSLEWLEHDAKDSVLAFCRSGSGETLVAIVNMRGTPVTVHADKALAIPQIMLPILKKNAVAAYEGGCIRAGLLGYGYLALLVSS